MRRYFFVLLFLWPATAPAQKQGRALTDSLSQQLVRNAGHGSDTARVMLENELSYQYRYIDPDEGIRYGRQGLQLASKLGWAKGVAEANRCIGSNCSIKSDFPEALGYYFKALETMEAAGDKKSIARIMGEIGNVYKHQKNYPKALEYEQKALKLSEELGDKQLIAANLGYIGLVYNHEKAPAKALEYMNRAAAIDEATGDKRHLAYDEINIGNFYIDLRDYAKALEYGFRALALNQALGDKNGIALDLTDIAQYYLEMDHDTATRIADTGLIPAGRNARLAKAIYYFNLAIPLDSGINFLVGLKDCYENLADADARLGNYEAALTAFKQYKLLEDSIFSNDNKVKIANESAARAEELNQKQVEINRVTEAKKRQEQQFFIAGIIILAAIILIIFRNNKLLSFEKKKSDGLLLNILPAEVAHELKERGAADAKLFEPVTVFFSDFVGFTTVSERLSPQQLVGELHACFKGFDEIIKKYNIEKIKTVGDAYLAVAGLPAANPHHAADMVAAAIEIRDFMLQRRAQLGPDTFQVRIGINTGSVVAGIVGVTKFAYDIWGDTVNTAARMEQNSEAGKINLSHSTWQLVKDTYNCTYRGKIAAKNKGEIDMYFCEGKE